MGKQAQEKRIRCLGIAMRIRESIEVRIFKMMMELQGLYQELSIKYSKKLRRRRVPVFSARFCRFIMRKYMIFCRYIEYDVGLWETEALSNSLVESRRHFRRRIDWIRCLKIRGLPGSCEEGSQEQNNKANIDECKKFAFSFYLSITCWGKIIKWYLPEGKIESLRSGRFVKDQ